MGKAAAKLPELHPARGKKPGHLDIRLFGHLEIALDGAPFALATPRKSLQVLAYLLLHRGVPVSREYLAFLLYPDDEESAARAKLRATLSELPKILPRPVDRYVTIDTEKIGWCSAADIWIDVDAFEAASRQSSSLDKAIDLYSGDLLPEIYDDWLDVIRERYRNAYLRCLSERISQARRQANLTLAIELARRMLAVDPWREDVVRRIIAMRYESGDAAGALNEYAGFAQRLGAEMRAEPMAETVAVAERVRRGQAMADDDGETERLTTAAASAMLPFVGRRDEMDRLLESWSRVTRGRGSCAFVGGEAGIGKSRIVYELTHAVEEVGGRVLVGGTSSPEAVPYESVVNALRSALPLVVSLKPSVGLACVAALVPEIRARAALPAVARLDAESERIRLFDSLFRCIADLAAPRPVLLVLEDLHWAQPASIELLEFLLRRIAVVPVMVVVTYRDDETPRLHALHRVRREARAAAGGESLFLSPLSVADVEELRTTLPDLRDRPADALVAASHGNPLFLTQLVTDVRDGEPAVAASLQAAVERRVERLSERARTVVEIAACIGDRFSHDAVREVSAWDESELSDALDELLDRRIIREAGGRGFLEYAFTHQLVFETIARGVSPREAAIRRRRVARVLEELYPERASELSATLAGHYECAGDIENALRCYLEAVARSIDIGALQEARVLCDRALALATDSAARAGLLVQIATIESRRGRLAEAYGCSKAALACSRDAENSADEARALCLMAFVKTHRGHLVTAQKLFEEALQVATRAADPELELLALRQGCGIAYQRRDIARCKELGQRCLQLAVSVGDRSAEAQSNGFLGVALAAEGHDCRRAREHYATAGRLYRELDDLAGTAVQFMNRAVLEVKVGFFERALTATEKAVELFERAGDARGHVGALANLVFVRALSGEISGARQAAETTLPLARRAGFALLEASVLENFAFTEAAAGDYRRAIELAEASFAVRAHSDSDAWSGKTLADIAIWHAALGNLPLAHDAVQRLLSNRNALVRGTDWPSYCYWAAAQVFRLEGDSESADDALQHATALMEGAAGALEAEDRERFLALPWHADLRQAAATGRWPDPPR